MKRTYEPISETQVRDLLKKHPQEESKNLSPREYLRKRILLLKKEGITAYRLAYLAGMSQAQLGALHNEGLKNPKNVGERTAMRIARATHNFINLKYLHPPLHKEISTLYKGIA